MYTVGVPLETMPQERRVALCPDSVPALIAAGFAVGLADPLHAPQRIAQLASRGVTAFGLELMPRTHRAQDMDVLGSMATLTGYRAAVLAAERLPRCFPMFLTSTGMVRPARVLVLGAGVAGLQAIITARGLGAMVRCHDDRPGVRDQVERAGGTFIALDLGDGVGDCPTMLSAAFHRQQRLLMAQLVASSDVVIATARRAAPMSPPRIDAAMVASMQPGSVIVDLVAAHGGACELSRADAEVIEHGVTILAPSNLAAAVPHHASRLYSDSLTAFLRHAVRATDRFDLDDEIVCGTMLCRDGTVVHPQVRRCLGMEPLA